MLTLDDLFNLLFSPPFFVPLIYPGILVLMGVIILTIWFERKVAAKVQLRYGPLYILKPLGGVIQLVADLVRYLFAEVILPRGIDRLMFILAPILAFTFAFVPVVILPVGPQFYAFRSDLSLLMVMALMTISPIFIVLIGWASDNKYSFIGSLREGYMVMAYEIPAFLAVLAMAVAYNTLDIIDLINYQSTGAWGLLVNPLAAVVFLICTFMMSARLPFEVTEADQELVMGPFTEYSGIVYGLGMAYGYIKLYALSLVFAGVFLGGWNPLVWPFTIHPVLPGFILFGKALVVIAFGTFLRSVYPRFRIDQLLRFGWKELLILSVSSIILSFALIALGVLK